MSSLRKAPQTNKLTNPAIEKILQRTKVPKEAHAEILHYVDMLKASKANDADDEKAAPARGLSVGEFLAWIDDPGAVEIPARTGTISETAGAEQPRISISAKLALALQKMADSKLIVSLRKAPQTNKLTNPAIEKILQRTKVPKEAHAEILHYVDMLKASKTNDADDGKAAPARGLSVGEFLAWIDDPGEVEIPARSGTIFLSPQEQTRKKLVKKNLKRVDSRTAVEM